MGFERVIVHFGFPKAGSTTIQSFLNTSISSSLTLDRVKRIEQPGHRPLFPHLRRILAIEPPGYWHSSRSGVLVDRLKSIADELSRHSSTLVLSWENLVDIRAFLPRPEFGLATGAPWQAPSHVAEILNIVAPQRREVELLVTLRRQPEFIGALYAQYSNNFAVVGQAHFERLTRGLLELDPGMLGYPLNYDQIISGFEGELRPTATTILPLELVGSDDYLHSFLATLSGFDLDSHDVKEMLQRVTNSRRGGLGGWQLRDYSPNSWLRLGGHTESAFSRKRRKAWRSLTKRSRERQLIRLTPALEKAVMDRCVSTNTALVRRFPLLHQLSDWTL